MATAANRAASSERNHTPVLPSGAVTYVRTLVSGNRDSKGGLGEFLEALDDVGVVVPVEEGQLVPAVDHRSSADIHRTRRPDARQGLVVGGGHVTIIRVYE